MAVACLRFNRGAMTIVPSYRLIIYNTNIGGGRGVKRLNNQGGDDVTVLL